MISILIPVYHQNIVKLVQDLSLQAFELKIDFEIICIDDLSAKRTKEKNRVLNSLQFVNYIESSEKLGRSRIRNRLSKLARYSWLMYLDCDSGVENPNFIKIYLEAIKSYTAADVIYGGTLYQKHKPQENKILHWKYGKKREELAASVRARKTILNFHSNNFLVKNQFIEKYPFDMSIDGYGYEDLAWAYAIEQNGGVLMHIDNPVIHLGLKPADDYLTDIRKSISNLSILFKKNKIPQSRLISASNFLISWGLLNPFQLVVSRLESRLNNQLLGPKPQLWVLDLLKLFYFNQARAKHI